MRKRRNDLMNQDFWNRPAEDLMVDLYRREVMTDGGVYVVAETEGFTGLINQSMLEAWEAKNDWEPGDVCVVPYRQAFFFNIVCKTKNKPQPQLVKLYPLYSRDFTGEDPRDGEKVTMPAVLREMDIERSGGKNWYEHAVDQFQGTNVLRHDAPLRILCGARHALEKNVHYRVDRGASMAKNSIGRVVPAGVTYHPTMQEYVADVVQAEAKRLHTTVDTLIRDRETMMINPILRTLMQRIQTLELSDD